MNSPKAEKGLSRKLAYHAFDRKKKRGIFYNLLIFNLVPWRIRGESHAMPRRWHPKKRGLSLFQGWDEK